MVSTTEYSALRSTPTDIPQQMNAHPLANTYDEVFVAGYHQKVLINGNINTTVVCGSSCPLHLSCVYVERQTIMTTPQHLSSTNYDMMY